MQTLCRLREVVPGEAERAPVDNLLASHDALRSATWRLNPLGAYFIERPGTYCYFHLRPESQWCTMVRGVWPSAPYDRVDSGHQQLHALQSWTGIGARNMRWPG
jgi:hypothetical protein